MTDILELAQSQRDELYDEIAKLDAFIRTARDLTERSGTTPKPATEPKPAHEDRSAAGPAPAGAAEDGPPARPWATAQPPQGSESQDGDGAGATRRNLLRR